jgi:cystathionine beta-lyase
LIFEGNKHIPIASLDPEIARKTITLMAPSKTFNVAGLNCSFAIIQNKDMRKKYLSATKGLVSGVNLFGYIAAEEAYREGGEWLDQLLIYLQSNRDYLCEFANTRLPGITIWQPQGTYLGWLNCRQLELEVSPYEFFLKEAKVALNEGGVFGRGGEGFVRVNFGCPRETLVLALERIRTSLL